MSYDIQQMALISVPAHTNVPNIWSYINTDDTLATIEAAGYFDDEVRLELNDCIRATGSDGTAWLRVSQAPPSEVQVVVDTNAVSSLTDGDIWVGNASNAATAVTPSGDITMDNAGVFAIAAGVIVNADVKSDAAIAFSKMEDVTDGEIIVGSAANVPTAVAMSGDVAIDNAGATTIQALAVETGMLADEAVTSAKVDETLVQHAQVDVDLATFIGSYTASALLVAAPGASKKLVLHRATLWIDYGGTVLADGGAVHIQYDSTANGAGTKATGTLAAATLISATADTSFGFSPVDTTLVDSTTLNKGLYLAAATQDFTGGTSSAYKLDVWYSVMDVS